MYVQVLGQENRMAEAKSNGWGIRVTCLFYLSDAFPKNTQIHRMGLRGTWMQRRWYYPLNWAKYTKNAKDIRDTIWPEGFDPDAAGAICVNV